VIISPAVVNIRTSTFAVKWISTQSGGFDQVILLAFYVSLIGQVGLWRKKLRIGKRIRQLHPPEDFLELIGKIGRAISVAKS
jgi:hypothetical protein